jgi:hypothetical protein
MRDWSTFHSLRNVHACHNDTATVYEFNRQLSKRRISFLKFFGKQTEHPIPEYPFRLPDRRGGEYDTSILVGRFQCLDDATSYRNLGFTGSATRDGYNETMRVSEILLLLIVMA